MLDFATFSGSGVIFNGATFSGAKVVFESAKFSDGVVDFRGADMSGGQVKFDGATFSGGKVVFAYRDPITKRILIGAHGVIPLGVVTLAGEEFRGWPAPESTPAR